MCDFPVGLEPILPNAISYLPNKKPIDDARLLSFFGRLFAAKQSGNVSESENNLSALPWKNPGVEVVSFQVRLPNTLKISFKQNEQLLLNLSNSTSFISFEIIGTSDFITFQITCPRTEKNAVFAQLNNHLSTVSFIESEDLLEKHLLLSQTNQIAVDFGLARQWFLPLPGEKNFAADTLLPLIAAFEGLASGEMACLQVLFSRTRQNWQRTAQGAIFDRNGKLAFSELQNYLASIKEKLSSPVLAAQIRLAINSGSLEKSLQLARQTSAFFRQFSDSAGNELIPLKNEGVSSEKHIQSILHRITYRSGMLLSAQELSSICRLPSDVVRTKKLLRDENRTKSAPEFATKGNIILGENHHSGQTQIIKLSDKQRLKHIWITGGSGCGKSSLITQIAEQDAKAKNGFCIIEPHDLINEVIARIPDNRLCDVILFDPTDEEPVGFNPLQSNSEIEKNLLSSDLVAIFQRFWTSQGDIMSNVLHNSILAFLSSTKGGTLIDLKHFLVNKEFRLRFLETVPDEEIRFYWQNEFPSLAKRITPLLTRLDLFLRSKPIRNVLNQKDSKLDFRRIMDERKILLVKLTHGSLGENNSKLIGALLIAKIYQTALSRQDVGEADRPAFFVSLDEARHYLSIPSMSLLLSEGRKYGISILASHQDTQQITSQDTDVLSSLTTNCYTRIAFRSDSDAERLAKGFSFFTADHLKNLGVGEAICRFEQSRYDFNLKTCPLEPIESEIAEQRRKFIVEHTRKTYGKSKAEIESENQSVWTAPSRMAAKQPSSEVSPKNMITEITAEDQRKAGNNLIKENHGRGGSHHQEIQAVIRRMAESYGFSVEIEKSVLDGAGSIDVSLVKEDLKIACEVSVTSTIDYETKNILKCLAAGYDYAVVVVSNQKKLTSLNAKLRSEIPVAELDKVKAFGLTGLLGFLRELNTPKEVTQKRPDKSTGQRLSFAETCEFFGVGASTLYRWIREGRVPFYRPGREYQFDREELVLIGKHDLSGKRKASVKLQPLKIEKNTTKSKKEQDSRYRKLLNLN